MNSFDLNAKTLERKKGYMTYLKEAEKITEFLIIIGANNAMLKFEDIRILRDMSNSVNRLVNCETANLNKTIGASFDKLKISSIFKEQSDWTCCQKNFEKLLNFESPIKMLH